MKKRKIILLSIIIIIVAILIWIMEFNIKSYIKVRTKEALKIYETVHDIYSYGGILEYKENFVVINSSRYYEVANYDKVISLFEEKEQKDFNEYFDIKIKNSRVYARSLAQGSSNYKRTDLKLKKIGVKKIQYIAISIFCEENKYKDFCPKEKQKTVEKPFTIVKEDNKWKVLEYTSVFQFSDRELK